MGSAGPVASAPGRHRAGAGGASLVLAVASSDDAAAPTRSRRVGVTQKHPRCGPGGDLHRAATPDGTMNEARPATAGVRRYGCAMGKGEDLEALSSRELHDRAVHRAVRHLDVGFLWQLLRELPAAEAAEGHEDVATGDAIKLSALISDALASGEGDVAEGLRPLYISYLEKHAD